MNSAFIEITNFMKTLFSKITQIGGHVQSVFSGVGFSKFVKNLSMWFFNDEVRNDKWEKFIQYGAGAMPFILNSPTYIVRASVFNVQKTSKRLMNKFHKIFVGIRNLQSGAIVDFVSSYPSLDIDGSFAVQNPREINDLFFCPHGYMISGRDFSLHRKRLNPEDHVAGAGKVICDSLNTTYKRRS